MDHVKGYFAQGWADDFKDNGYWYTRCFVPGVPSDLDALVKRYVHPDAGYLTPEQVGGLGGWYFPMGCRELVRLKRNNRGWTVGIHLGDFIESLA